ncbi:MAG: hypothetical protein EDM03_16180 [Porphyrobacter sp. IPPAS B-1204]|nr:MAG: hypothetical protein EDM03_16180 [Porphyrobacter sp. IPPAS B-1204]
MRLMEQRCWITSAIASKIILEAQSQSHCQITTIVCAATVLVIVTNFPIQVCVAPEKSFAINQERRKAIKIARGTQAEQDVVCSPELIARANLPSINSHLWIARICSFPLC